MKRDIPDYHLKPHVPENPRSWYKAYRKLKKEASKAASDAEVALKATLSGIKNEKEQNTAEVASSAAGAALWRSTDAPGPSRRARMAYSYMSGQTGSKGANKMTVMQKIRKEARSAGTGVMGRPFHELKKKHNGVTRAPVAFVEDVKRAKVLQQAGIKKATIPSAGRSIGVKSPAKTSTAPWDLPPKPRPQPAAAAGVEPYDLNNDREARLRALKSGRPLPPMRPTPAYDPRTVSTNDASGSLTLDFLETDSDDELFGETKPSGQKRQRADDEDELFGGKRPIKNRQEEEDDELFGISKPSKKRRRISDDEDDDVSSPPKVSKATPLPTAKVTSSPPSKLLKPLGHEDLLRPHSRSNSPLKLSPANSPRLQATKVKKREAPSLFMKRK
jgi:hypothetical protein